MKMLIFVLLLFSSETATKPGLVAMGPQRAEPTWPTSPFKTELCCHLLAVERQDSHYANDLEVTSLKS